MCELHYGWNFSPLFVPTLLLRPPELQLYLVVGNIGHEYIGHGDRDKRSRTLYVTLDSRECSIGESTTSILDTRLEMVTELELTDSINGNE